MKRNINNNMSPEAAQASFEAKKVRLPDGMYGCKLVSAEAIEHITSGPNAGKPVDNPFIRLLFKVEHTEKNGIHAGRTFTTNLVFFSNNPDSLERTLLMADYIFQHGEPKVMIQTKDVVVDESVEGGLREVVTGEVERPVYTCVKDGQFDIAEIAKMMKDRLCGDKGNMLMVSIRTPKQVEGQPVYTGFNLVSVFSPRDPNANDVSKLPTMD